MLIESKRKEEFNETTKSLGFRWGVFFLSVFIWLAHDSLLVASVMRRTLSVVGIELKYVKLKPE